jgi:hypothetical protein
MVNYKNKYFAFEKLDFEKKLPQLPLNGKNWQINYFKKNKKENYLLIESNSSQKAYEAIDLVYASSSLSHSCIYFEKEIKIKKFTKNINLESFSYDGLMHYACLIATKASFKRKYIYAIFKLYKSYQLVSIPPIKLYPYEEIKKPSINKPLPPNTQTSVAFAILAAYSAIEELGFQPPKIEKTIVKKRQQEKVKIINRENGIWNKESKKRFESLLEKNGINPRETILWTLRGHKTQIEKNRKTKKIKKPHWAYGLVRDEEILLIDAIADASWLRSKVTAHVFSSGENLNRLKTLSIYDVTNVQNLARELILKSLNLSGVFRENKLAKRKIKNHNYHE